MVKTGFKKVIEMRAVLVSIPEPRLDMLLHLIDKVSHTRDPFYTKEEIEELYSELAQLKEDLNKDVLDEWKTYTKDIEEDTIDFSDLEQAYEKLIDFIDFLGERVDDEIAEECRDRIAEIQDLIMEFVRKNYPDAIDE